LEANFREPFTFGRSKTDFIVLRRKRMHLKNLSAILKALTPKKNPGDQSGAFVCAYVSFNVPINEGVI